MVVNLNDPMKPQIDIVRYGTQPDGSDNIVLSSHIVDVKKLPKEMALQCQAYGIVKKLQDSASQIRVADVAAKARGLDDGIAMLMAGECKTTRSGGGGVRTNAITQNVRALARYKDCTPEAILATFKKLGITSEKQRDIFAHPDVQKHLADIKREDAEQLQTLGAVDLSDLAAAAESLA